MIRKWTKADLDKKVGNRSTVAKFYVNKALPYILLDDKLVIAVEKMEDRFDAVFVSQSINSVFALAGSGTHVGKSQHYYGRGIDLALRRPDGTFVDTLEMARYAEAVPEIKGIGLYASRNKHIHIDTRLSRCYWWLVTSGSNTPSFGGVSCVYRLGHRSPVILEAQKKLHTIGLYDGVLNGKFTSEFRTAVMEFQKAHGLKVDGAMGVQTLANM